MKRLTILVPTLNRQDFLERLLFYYITVDNDYEIFVGDGGINDGTVKNICNRFNAKYYNLHGLSIGETIKELNKHVVTPYVAILPDDDILIPDGVNKCMAMLDKDLNFIACNGLAAEFMLYKSGAWGHIRDLGDYKMRAILSPEPINRLFELYEKNFVSLFSIFRTDSWVKMWLHTGESKDVGINDEITPDAISVVLGRIAHINDLFLLRQLHDRRYLGISGDEWKQSKDFIPSRQTFINAVGKYVPKAIAIKVFDDNYTNAESKVKKKHKSRYIPILSELKIALLNRKRVVSLPKLRNKLNPAYSDFKVFESIVNIG